MTVVQPNSIAGINSISVQSGQSLSIHKSDGTLIREIVASTGISTFSSISVGSAATANNAGKSINIGLGASISQHSDNTLSFGTNGIVRARITSAGNIGVGNDASFPIYTDSGDRTLILGSGSDDAAIQLHSGTDKYGGLYFGDTTSGGDRYSGYVEYKHDDNFLRFGTGGTERVRITSAGDVGISTVAPASKLHLYDAASDGLILQSPSGLHYIWAIQSAGNLNNGSLAGELAIRGQSGVSISANNGTGTQLRLTSDGRLRLGASTDEDIHTGEGADLQVVSADAGGLTFARDDTTVSNGANLGVIRAYGNDNDGTYQEVAKIEFQADLNHGTNDKPGRLVFSTTSDGGSSTTERMRITSAGRVNIVGVCSAAGGFIGDGSNLTGVSAGVQTALQTATNAVVTLDLSKQDHKLTLAGICTVDCKGGTEGDAHTVRIINSGIATVGFSTYFLFPSGASPVLPSTNTAINQISFTVHHVGAGATQLLAGASLNYG